VAVIDRVVRSSSRVGDVILDPFMGSGTTAEVGIRTNRLVLGFEIEPKYIRIAEKRIDKVLQLLEDEARQQPLID